MDHPGPVAANRARSALSKLYAWAIGEGLCDSNPVIGTNKRDEKGPRERSLSNAEVAQVWLGAGDDDYGRILKLLLLTGCRRAEIGDLKWSEIDLEARTITLPGERTKNGQQHVVPLTDSAIAILSGIVRRADREYVFGHTRAGGFCSWSVPKREIDAILKVKEPWTVHDLRRTAARRLRNSGLSEQMIMRIGGGRTTSVFHRYAIVNRQDMAAAMRELEQHQAELARARAENEHSLSIVESSEAEDTPTRKLQ